jgi:hypothetical protein
MNFQDYKHVFRMAAIFVLGISTFLIFRSAMVPKDFGVYGHYRAGALTEIAARRIQYAGRAACIECHSDIQQMRAGGKHAGIGCESCHGPLAKHTDDSASVVPQRPDSRDTCLRCHTARPSKPAGFPQILPAEHAPEGTCTECHKAHNPTI